MPIHYDPLEVPAEQIDADNHYNINRGWTLMIAPQVDEQTTLIQGLGIDENRVIAFPRRHCENVFSALKTALKCNNCSTVVVWPGVLSEFELHYLLNQANICNVKVLEIEKLRMH